MSTLSNLAADLRSIRHDRLDQASNPLRVFEFFQNLLPVRVVGLLAKDPFEFGDLLLVVFLLGPQLIPMGLLLLGHRSGDAHAAGFHVDDDVVGMREGLGARR